MSRQSGPLCGLPGTLSALARAWHRRVTQPDSILRGTYTRSSKGHSTIPEGSHEHTSDNSNGQVNSRRHRNAGTQSSQIRQGPTRGDDQDRRLSIQPGADPRGARRQTAPRRKQALMEVARQPLSRSCCTRAPTTIEPIAFNEVTVHPDVLVPLAARSPGGSLERGGGCAAPLRAPLTVSPGHLTAAASLSPRGGGGCGRGASEVPGRTTCLERCFTGRAVGAGGRRPGVGGGRPTARQVCRWREAVVLQALLECGAGGTRHASAGGR